MQTPLIAGMVLRVSSRQPYTNMARAGNLVAKLHHESSAFIDPSTRDDWRNEPFVRDRQIPVRLAVKLSRKSFDGTDRVD
jgi:hypothetical protein